MEAERLLRRTAELAIDYLGSMADRPVGPTASRDEMLAILGGDLPPAGDDAEAVIERLAAAAETGLSASVGPRYFGFVIGGSLPAALAADWLTGAWDQNAGIHAISPAAAVAEDVAGEWLKQLLGLPAGSSFGFTTGCQMAHVTCLGAARHAVLERASWDVERRGLIGAPPVTILAGDEAHVTIFAALGYLGLGYDSAIRIDSDAQGRMRIDALAAALPDGDGPLIVCLQAGNVNTGSFDPLAEAISLIRERQPHAWIHVDGAFGLWAAAGPATRHLLAGVERADSWATDGHKWLNVPYDAGYAFVADPAVHRAAMAPPTAAYVPESAVERDQSWWVTEYSRRARGFATWAALRSLGSDGVRELIERCCAHARRFAEQLASADGIEILNEVVLNQVLVRFGDDATTRAVVERVQEEGTLWLSATTWHGMAAMRISVTNWSTSEADVDRSVAAILDAHRASR